MVTAPRHIRTDFGYPIAFPTNGAAANQARSTFFTNPQVKQILVSKGLDPDKAFLHTILYQGHRSQEIIVDFKDDSLQDPSTIRIAPGMPLYELAFEAMTGCKPGTVPPPRPPLPFLKPPLKERSVVPQKESQAPPIKVPTSATTQKKPPRPLPPVKKETDKHATYKLLIETLQQQPKEYLKVLSNTHTHQHEERTQSENNRHEEWMQWMQMNTHLHDMSARNPGPTHSNIAPPIVIDRPRRLAPPIVVPGRPVRDLPPPVRVPSRDDSDSEEYFTPENSDSESESDIEEAPPSFQRPPLIVNNPPRHLGHRPRVVRFKLPTNKLSPRLPQPVQVDEETKAFQPANLLKAQKERDEDSTPFPLTSFDNWEKLRKGQLNEEASPKPGTFKPPSQNRRKPLHARKYPQHASRKGVRIK